MGKGQIEIRSKMGETFDKKIDGSE